jgi:cytochrome c-type biogenesis protein CcmH/NrfG
MSKKYFIIAIAILVSAVFLAGGFLAYKKGYLKMEKELKPEDLLAFEIKKKDLDQEIVKIYQAKYEQVKILLEKNPDSFNEWLALAVFKKGVGDFEGARDIYLYCQKIRPNSSVPLVGLADLYLYSFNDAGKAEAYLKQAMTIDQNDYFLILRLAEIYRYKMPGKEALYEQTILGGLQKFPDNVDLTSALATYYRQTEQIEKAIQYYEKLVALDPNNKTAKDDLEELKKKQ